MFNFKPSVFTNRVYFCVLRGFRSSIVSCAVLNVFCVTEGMGLLCGSGCTLNTNRVDSDLY